MIDPDKIVDKFNERRRNLYKNYKHSKPYENEGSEFVTIQPNKRDNEVNKENEQNHTC